MHSISGIIYLILAACFLPYAFTLIAKKTAGFQQQRQSEPTGIFSKSLQAWPVAPMLYNKIALKVYLYLLPAILMAEYMVVPQSVVMTLGCSLSGLFV